MATSKWSALPIINPRHLMKDVEDFKKRLGQRIEWTEKSIERLSSDCISYCSKVQQEFDAFIEKTRTKSKELCDQINLKTNELKGKWGKSLEEKKNLLKEAEKWLRDLKLLAGPGKKKETVGEPVELIEEELSGRLHESFAPVKEGHFVVTVPEWCQRSLDQLQKEIVDFTIETWPPRELKLESEFRLQDSKLEISSIAVSDEANYVFVYDGGDISFKNFSVTGEFLNRCPLEDKGFLPWEICCLSKGNFVVCGPLWSESGMEGGILYWKEKEEIIKTKEKPFCSLCQINKEIFVCDLDFKEILCFSQDGTQIKRIQLQNSPLSGLISDPLLRADPTTGNLWGTRRGMLEMIVFDQNGQILQIVKTREKILDFCADEFGQFYFCNKEGIFSVLPEKVLYKFPKESEIFPRIFVLGKKFFVCFENDGENLMKIFEIKEKT